MSDDAPEDRLPTYVNVAREFERLASAVAADDEVLIYFSGHGTQQPDQSDALSDDVEPDGLDEVLCTRDVRKITVQEGNEIPGAIVDDVLKTWLDAMLARRARVWVIIDSCHSGTAVRGDEATRGIPPLELLPQAAVRPARTSRGSATANDSLGHGEKAAAAERLVVLYAAQSNEPTVEKRLPRSGTERRPHGLLTFTLVETLSREPPGLTYREAAAKIAERYAADGRSSPTPWIEGRAADEAVFGASPADGRRELRLSTNRAGRPIITGGSVDGLAVGTVLAVTEKANEIATPLAHVRIVNVDLWESTVEPCTFAAQPAVVTLPTSASCRIVEAATSPAVLQLYLSPEFASAAGASHASHAWPAGIEIVAAPYEADWALRSQDDAWLLTPTAPSYSAQRIAATPGTPEFMAQLDVALLRLLRTQRLLDLAAFPAAATEPAVLGEIHCTLLPLVFDGPQDRTGKQFDVAEKTLTDGTIIAFEIVNRGATAVDVTLLFIAADGTVQSLFPQAGREGDARLPPGRSQRTARAVVESASPGVEHLLLIAASAEGAPQFFNWIAEEPVAWSNSKTNTTRGGGASTSARLRESLLGQTTTTRGGIDSVRLQKLTWRVSPRD